MSEGSSVTLLVGVGTAVGAFLGIFVTALLSRASATTALRQNWINSLREVLSKYLTHAEIFIDVPDRNSEEAYRAKIALIEYVHQAKLYLNEDEKKSGDLLKLMQDLLTAYSRSKHAAKEYRKKKNKISSLMQEVLKEEWNRVRDGEILWSINNTFKLIGLPKWFNISRIRLFWVCILLVFLYAVYRVCTQGF